MKKEICECCDGKPIQENQQGQGFNYTWTCPYCEKTGFIFYKWWEWIIVIIWRKGQEIDSRQYLHGPRR